MNNKVYDITEFVPHHPGGDIVKFCAGRDGTDMLESYHPSVGQIKALNLLEKYYIGELANAVRLSPLICVFYAAWSGTIVSRSSCFP